MIPAFVLTGASGAGKTTLLIGLIRELKARGFRVAALKQDAHHIQVDQAGKDSWRYAQAGADVTMVSGPGMTAQMEPTAHTLAENLSALPPVDLALVESYHADGLPQIGVCRPSAGFQLLAPAETFLAIVSDTPLPAAPVPCLDLNDIRGLADLLLSHAGLTPSLQPPDAYFLRQGMLRRGMLQEAFPFLAEAGHVISLVGGGGKTSLTYALAHLYAQDGRRTVVMTTTHMGCPAQWRHTLEDCEAAWTRGEVAVCGQRTPEGKFRAPQPELLQALLTRAEAILIEADGARRLPCKAPAAHEPVLLPETDIVLGVMGLDALGMPVERVCLRTEQVQGILGCDGQHHLTAADLTALLLSPLGSRKGADGRDFYAVLNKCDDAFRLAEGARILTMLEAQGCTHAALTHMTCRSESYEHPPQASQP